MLLLGATATPLGDICRSFHEGVNPADGDGHLANHLSTLSVASGGAGMEHSPGDSTLSSQLDTSPTLPTSQGGLWSPLFVCCSPQVVRSLE
jgi:hypothetical protein